MKIENLFNLNHRVYTLFMRSKWFEIKRNVIEARLSGMSIREAEKKFKIPKSTLSGWFKDVELTDEFRSKLKKKWLKNLVKARTKAVKWHNFQKEIRLRKAENDAQNLLSKINLSDKVVLELALSMLYFGEGAKSNATSIGNSNPVILNFFVTALEILYDFDVSKIKCELHLRADQNIEEVKKYWSKALKLPLDNFTNVSVDKRTEGSVTYPHYQGVCILRCANIAIQRRLVYLSQIFCEKVANQRAVSSVGRASA